MGRRIIIIKRWTGIALVAAAAFALTTCEPISLRSTIDNMILGWSRAVLLVSPADGEERAEKTPLLDWEDAGGATGYELQIVEAEDQLDGAEVIALTESQYEFPEPLIICDKKYWRVRAVKEGEVDPGPWSETRNFEIVISETPLLLGEVATGGNPFKMELQGNYVYIPLNETKIVDISNPSDPVIVGTIAGEARDLVVRDQYLYIMLQVQDPDPTVIQVWDVSVPSSPIYENACSLSHHVENFGGADLQFFGDNIYVTVQRGPSDAPVESGVMKIDVSTPTAPVVAGFNAIVPSVALTTIIIPAHFAFITAPGCIYSYGLNNGEILDYFAIDSLFDSYMDTKGDYLFVSNANGPLSIIDFSTPTDLILTSEYAAGGKANYYTAVYRNYLFTFTFPEGKQHIVDISDISAPYLYTIKDELPVNEIIGNYAYGLDYVGGRLMITDLIPGD
ncbi:MAG: hypothetical protein E4H36_13060 [Spirochaetales bacterium]|nr:MAG: hypothetical protein E4H36_13060 [Spirochaetales bacterium]